MSTFLLEIGTEEIPHWMIPGALSQLEKLDLFGAIPKVDATPRRLVVRATGLPKETQPVVRKIAGPNKMAGALAKAGFARKQMVDPSELVLEGEQYVLNKTTPGRPVVELLVESLPKSILGIQWPKTMYWGAKGSPRFIRPIRWIVGLLDDEIINFEVAGVKSGNVTRVHRMYSGVHPMYTYATVETVLKSYDVILSAEERRNKIETEAKKLGATIDPELLETLTYITECPAAIRGDFDPAYLELPAEVLTMVMRHHQKYFAVETNPGVLAPHFVAVMNIPADPDGEVKKGNERVLKARFNDARFFWEVDQKKKLADRVEDLSHVTFHARLGSYLDKTKRVEGIVKEIGGDEHAQRGARLAKADLTTEMVKEFTDLQGVIGGLYAKYQGESDTVSAAIYEHYKPLSMEDSIPSTEAGQILAIADKLDNLREFFRIDYFPKGSSDPFALRRAAQGIVKILFDAKLQIPAFTAEPNGVGPFMVDRIRTFFRESRGFKYDEVNAALRPATTTLDDLEARLNALAEVRPTENFEPLAISFKRIKKILEQANYKGGRGITESDFQEGAERELFREYERVYVAAGEHFGRNYLALLKIIASTRPAIDRFFEEVMVMVEDQYTRESRLELLHRIKTYFSTIADFSEIVTSGDQK